MKTLILVMLGLVLTASAALAVDTVLPPDFRVAAGTNKPLYHNKDVLELTVTLLNDGTPLKIVPIIPTTTAIETNTAQPAMLNDEAVDVLVRPNANGFVGVAKIIPLVPVVSNDAAIADANMPPVYHLPLFGQTEVAGHSTRIIARTHILVGLPPAANEEPSPSNTPTPIEQQKIPAIGVFNAPHPGDYLVQVDIMTIDGVRMARAEKIIRIAPRQPNPEMRLAVETNNIVKGIDNKVAKDIELDNRIYLTTTMNKNYLMTILRYMLGIRPATTTATTTTVTP